MPNAPDFFQNKTIVITDVGSGMGHATAIIFAREGVNVLCASVNRNAAKKLLSR